MIQPLPGIEDPVDDLIRPDPIDAVLIQPIMCSQMVQFSRTLVQNSTQLSVPRWSDFIGHK